MYNEVPCLAGEGGGGERLYSEVPCLGEQGRDLYSEVQYIMDNGHICLPQWTDRLKTLPSRNFVSQNGKKSSTCVIRNKKAF